MNSVPIVPIVPMVPTPAAAAAEGSFSETARPNILRPGHSSILRPGHNCAEVAQAPRVKMLVDAEAYFKAFMLAAERAQERIFILSWDFDSRIPLDPDARDTPASLGGRILHPWKGRGASAAANASTSRGKGPEASDS